MQSGEVPEVEDTHTREERQLSPEERSPEAQQVFEIPGNDIPIPFVSTVFDCDSNIGRPGLYIEIEKPEIAQTRPFGRLIVHHKDILLKRLPPSQIRANFIYLKAWSKGWVKAKQGTTVTTVFLAKLDQPEVAPVLVGWENLLIENSPRLNECLEAVGAIYGKSLPKEDWELTYFLSVLWQLDDLFSLTNRGPISGNVHFVISRQYLEGFARPAVAAWYREYQIYISLVQFQLRSLPGQRHCVLDRVPTWQAVMRLGLEPRWLHPDYYMMYPELEGRRLGPVVGLQRQTWEDLWRMEREWVRAQN
jgi:hypothetical protein